VDSARLARQQRRRSPATDLQTVPLLPRPRGDDHGGGLVAPRDDRDNPDDALAEEIRILIGEVRMGKTESEAMESFRDRVGVADIKNAANALIQANQMGTPIGRVVRDQSEVMRFKRSQDAERMAEEIKVRIQGPTMMMMMSVFLLILGPAFIRVMRSGIF
jgi:tight adherence protein C